MITLGEFNAKFSYRKECFINTAFMKRQAVRVVGQHNLLLVTISKLGVLGFHGRIHTREHGSNWEQMSAKTCFVLATLSKMYCHTEASNHYLFD